MKALREKIAQPQDPSYRYIPLTQNQIAIVSTHRYEELSQWNWYARWSPLRKTFEAVRNIYRADGSRTSISMHRQVRGMSEGDRLDVDHVNHCGCDNRDENLRPCTREKNNQNRRKKVGCKSQYKGVTPHKTQWKAQIQLTGIKKYLGLHGTEIAAAKRYDEEATKFFGEFAVLNFPVNTLPPQPTES